MQQLPSILLLAVWLSAQLLSTGQAATAHNERELLYEQPRSLLQGRQATSADVGDEEIDYGTNQQASVVRTARQNDAWWQGSLA